MRRLDWNVFVVCVLVVAAGLVLLLGTSGCRTVTETRPDGSVVVTGPDWVSIVEVIRAFGDVIEGIGAEYGDEIAAAVEARLDERLADREADRARALRDEVFRQELIGEILAGVLAERGE